MTVNPSPMTRAFICPLCGAPIEAMTPEQTVNAPAPKDWDYSERPGETFGEAMQRGAEFRLAQNMEANEALIWAHFESHHSLKEAVLALGVARNALMEIREILAGGDYAELKVDLVEPVVERGLGNV